MNRILCAASVCMILLAGCMKQPYRTISDSGYPGDYAPRSSPLGHELNEFDVLGIEPDRSVSEEEIAQASARAQHVALSKGSTILLIQSGTEYPDGPMVSALKSDFTVVPFSGISPSAAAIATHFNSGRISDTHPEFRSPQTVALVTGERYETRKPGEPPATQYSRMLRLAAARAGADKIVCYWGILESGSEHLATKTISWVPVVDWVVPDERLHMRIRIKVAVIDVKSGSWRTYSPEPFEDAKFTVSPRREVVDQKQVESLKTKAYTACATNLLAQFN